MTSISEEELLRMVFEAADRAARTLAEENVLLLVVAAAARDLVEVIERFRPLDAAGLAPGAYDMIHEAQDKLIEGLRKLDSKRD